MGIVERKVDFINPIARRAFLALNESLKRAYETGATKTNFQIYETYRSPQRQHELFLKKSTKAREFQSPHQYGLAVDFVPVIQKPAVGAVWTWSEDHDYEFLALEARKVDLAVPITWDRVHVEHPLWWKIKHDLIP